MNDLLSALKEQNDIGKVIKSHINIENELHTFIKHKSANEASVKALQLDFIGSLHLAVVLGLPDRYIPPLKSIGKLRNNFAHKLDQRLGSNEINNLYKSLHSDDKKEIGVIVKQYFEKNGGNPAPFSRLTVSDQFTVLVICLRASLHIACMTVIHEDKLQELRAENSQLTERSKEA